MQPGRSRPYPHWKRCIPRRSIDRTGHWRVVVARFRFSPRRALAHHTIVAVLTAVDDARSSAMSEPHATVQTASVTTNGARGRRRFIPSNLRHRCRQSALPVVPSSPGGSAALEPVRQRSHAALRRSRNPRIRSRRGLALAVEVPRDRSASRRRQGRGWRGEQRFGAKDAVAPA
jgi:hypothetical protein